LGSIVRRNKHKDDLKRGHLEMLQMSSKVLRTHLAMIQNEREMLQLREATLDHRQQLVQENEKSVNEARSRSGEQRFRLLVGALPCSIAQFDSEQHFRYCNKAYAKCFGLSQGKILGKYIWEVMGPVDYDALRPGIIRALQGEETTTELAFHGEKEQHFYCKFVPERTARDSVIGFFLLLLDISDRKAIERQLKEREQMFRNIAQERAKLLRLQEQVLEETRHVSRSKDLFLATVSHELRTPLFSILGWATLMRQKKVDGERADAAIEAIERNARHQAKLIEELLDVSRIAYGKLELKMEDVDVAALIRSVVDTIRPSFSEKNLELRLNVKDNRPAIVKADLHRLQQVIENLLTNSIKFTPSGGTIRVSVRTTTAHVFIEVKDNGQGISAAFLPHVFEYFQQANMSTNRSVGGLGLGLAISHRLVQLHGGTLKAKSRGVGFGATFEISLPLGTMNESHGPAAKTAA
jgi:PAS domain S-box-containing protein